MINIKNVDFILWNTEVHGQKKKLADSIGQKIDWIMLLSATEIKD